VTPGDAYAAEAYLWSNKKARQDRAFRLMGGFYAQLVRWPRRMLLREHKSGVEPLVLPGWHTLCFIVELCFLPGQPYHLRGAGGRRWASMPSAGRLEELT
jgi:hypothetical protein